MNKSMLKNCYFARTALPVYLVLVIMTLCTWLIGMAGAEGLGVALLVFAMALFKGQLIGSYFMQLKQVRGIWGWVIVIWLSFTAVLVGTAFILTAT